MYNQAVRIGDRIECSRQSEPTYIRFISRLGSLSMRILNLERKQKKRNHHGKINGTI